MRYRAFFSYARADDRIANWLHRQLDGYRTPKALVGTDGEVGPVPAKLHPIFRDRTDLEAGGHVDQSLQAALEDSETLVVLCTPTSAKSRWVNQECETFLAVGREARIFPVIAGGEPDSGDPETECFPPALRGKGLLAADLREIKLPSGQLVGDGREGGRLKLVAGLLGVPLDKLVQRERRRQRQTVAALTVAAIGFAGLAVAAIGLGLLAQKNAVAAQTNEVRAYNALARIFAERAWEQIERKNYALAARYLLAGWKSAPANEAEYRAPLAALMHKMQDGRIVASSDDEIERASLSPDGTSVLSFTGQAAELWNTADGRFVGGINVRPGHLGLAVVSTDGSRFVAGSDDSKPVQLWNVFTRQKVAPLVAALSANFSVDGARVATASQDGVRLWNARTGEFQGALPGVAGPAQSAAFSPDGRRIVTVAMLLGRETIYAIQVWDAVGFQQIARIDAIGIESAEVGVQVAFSPDSKLFVTSRYAGARVFDAETGRQIAELRGHRSAVRSARFSRDGRQIITAPYRGAARIWDARSGRVLAIMGGRDRMTEIWAARVAADRAAQAKSSDGEVGQPVSDEDFRRMDGDLRPGGRLTLRAQTNAWDMDSALLSPDKKHVVTFGRYNVARLWNATSGREIAALPHEDWVSGASFSPDGRRLLTASLDRTARIWDGQTGELRTVLIGHQDGVAEASFAANGIDVLTASRDGSVRVWPRPVRTVELRTSSDSFSEAVFAQAGARILTSASVPDGAELQGGRPYPVSVAAAQVWSSLDGSMLLQMRLAGTKFYRGARIAAVAPKASLMIAITRDGPAQVWDIARGVNTRAIETAGEEVETAAFSLNGAHVALAGGFGVWICDPATGVAILKLPLEKPSVATASFSPDGRRFVTASKDGKARVWVVSNLPQPPLVLPSPLPPQTARFSADGTRIATASDDGAASLWDAVSGKRISVLPGSKRRRYPGGMVISPDAHLVIGLSVDTAHVMNIAAGAVASVLRHPHPINSVVFSPDGRLIATASDDETARIWDTATGRQLAEFRHANRVNGASFDPDGKKLLTFADDQTARVWDIYRLGQPTNLLVRDACANILGPRRRAFSSLEIDEDPVIRDVWLKRGRRSGDPVCESR